MSEKSQNNTTALVKFLNNNEMDLQASSVLDQKFEVRYFVGERRVFAEDTRVLINVVSEDEVVIVLNEINDVEFVTRFNTSHEDFVYDEVMETLSITGDEPSKHEQGYKLVINSIYIEFI